MRAVSFDHLIGAGEQRGWHVEAERLGSLKIDRQIEPGGLLSRQVGRSRPLKDAINVIRSAFVYADQTHTIRHQSADPWKNISVIHGWQPIFQREFGNSPRICVHEWRG